MHQGLQRHLLQLGYTDELLGRILDRLEQQGMLEESLLVVTADHGASFRNGGHMREPVNIEDIAGVPLFIKLPAQRRGTVVRTPASVVDVLPTIADALDVRIPWRVDGVSLLSYDDGGPRSRKMAKRSFWAVVPDDLEQRTIRAAARNARIFSRGLYAFGPHAELMGEAAGSQTVLEGEGMSVRVDQWADLQRVRVDGGRVPLWLTGRFVGVAPGEAIAVAINGTIVTTTESYRDLNGPPTRLSVIVPPQSLRDGRNDVELFLIKGSGEGRSLLRIPVAGQDAETGS